ncbi:MAG: NTPase [Chloroflexota bacterium]|nr:NTPase [Chloroflexota bacterium]
MRACLLTGGPGVGKTTIVKRAVERVPGRAGGFYTEEIRQGGARQGFRLVTLDGESAVLAHVDIRSRHRVGRYGVDVEALDRVGVAAIEEACRERELVVIDEIGRMELFSTRFREAAAAAIDSDKRVLGAIMLAPHPWADEIKRRPQVEVLPVTRENRGHCADRVREWIDTIPVGKGTERHAPCEP